jgi:hypothetical protein
VPARLRGVLHRSSISAVLPARPHGKPAGVRCPHLTTDIRCALFGAFIDWSKVGWLVAVLAAIAIATAAGALWLALQSRRPAIIAADSHVRPHGRRRGRARPWAHTSACDTAQGWALTGVPATPDLDRLQSCVTCRDILRGAMHWHGSWTSGE